MCTIFRLLLSLVNICARRDMSVMQVLFYVCISFILVTHKIINNISLPILQCLIILLFELFAMLNGTAPRDRFYQSSPLPLSEVFPAIRITNERWRSRGNRYRTTGVAHESLRVSVPVRISMVNPCVVLRTCREPTTWIQRFLWTS